VQDASKETRCPRELIKCNIKSIGAVRKNPLHLSSGQAIAVLGCLGGRSLAGPHVPNAMRTLIATGFFAKLFAVETALRFKTCVSQSEPRRSTTMS
jgi:hypothetical protein